MSNSAFIEKHPKPAIIERSLLQQLILPQQQQGQTKVIDVYGQQTEPICNYHTYIQTFGLNQLIVIPFSYFV
jgi:hypothetical protein